MTLLRAVLGKYLNLFETLLWVGMWLTVLMYHISGNTNMVVKLVMSNNYFFSLVGR